MSEPRPAQAVKLVASVLSARDDAIGAAVRALAEEFGRPDFISAPLSFEYTDYYAGEMGAPLRRRFVSFETLFRPERLPDAKLFTNQVEKASAGEGKRREMNIDPGYLSQAHLILATGKGYAHRPYLRDGIYADLTLVFRQGSLEALPWTYPDYGAAGTIGLFNGIRRKYLLQLKLLRREDGNS
ncbi:MAG: hypothetical protein A4E73_03853 [Syntrophaceae bacterium PtaU1.Bin231]|nr:MAG: hypothetical protein A4E73_03853 [Syntrophaceae bacterium PtaU1.Bin231]HOG17254.1 DUF4416 family protein [Syntrophales bacterium]